MIPRQWNDRDGWVAKNTKHFQGVDLQPYSLHRIESRDDGQIDIGCCRRHTSAFIPSKGITHELEGTVEASNRLDLNCKKTE